MRKLFIVISALVVSLSSFLAAQAAAPSALSYHGVLRNSSGDLVADGSYRLTFSLYNILAGGSSIYSETKNVELKKGLFSTKLGSAGELVGLDLDQPLFLGIKVGSDTEMSPRVELASTPFALNSRKVDGKGLGGGANQIPTLDADKKLNLEGDITTSGKVESAGLNVKSGSVDLPAGSLETADLADGAVMVGKVNIASLDSTGKIKGISSDYFASLSGSSLTNLQGSALVDGSVTGAKILDGTVATVDLTDGAVTSGKILDGTIITTDLVDSAITSAKILDTTIATADLANASVTTAKLSIADGLNFSELADTLTIDADTTINVNNQELEITLAGGPFSIENSSTESDLFVIDPDNSVITLGSSTNTLTLSSNSTNGIMINGGSLNIRSQPQANGVDTDTLAGGLLIGTVNASSVTIGKSSGTSLTAVQGSLRIGTASPASSSDLDRYTETTSTVDFGTTADGDCSQSGDITISGAEAGDQVLAASDEGALAVNTFLTGHVTAANTIRIQFCNLSGAAVDPAGGAYRIRLFK